MAKKIKRKSHSGLNKVLKKRKNDVKRGKQNVLHNTGKKRSKTNRKNRNDKVVDKTDLKKIKRHGLLKD